METVTSEQMKFQMESFDSILQGKNVGWCHGPSVLALRLSEVGGSDQALTKKKNSRQYIKGGVRGAQPRSDTNSRPIQYIKGGVRGA